MDNQNKYLTEMLITQEVSRCLLCYDPPCSKACPAGTDPAKFIQSLRFRNFKGAQETAIINNPLSSVCSVSCSHKYCEGACIRKKIDRAIEIQKIHEYLTEDSCKINFNGNKRTVGVCAKGIFTPIIAGELAQNGYTVILFGKQSIIDEFSKYEEYISRDLLHLEQLGVVLKNQVINKGDIIDSIKEGVFDAFVTDEAIDYQGVVIIPEEKVVEGEIVIAVKKGKELSQKILRKFEKDVFVKENVVVEEEVAL
ncbi:hypothetical protein CPJCM30710_17430 [Clostridium polyendosporum]|uniref:dihydrouracil dehydrogenase (NAD(+)) n=1 Tax=Clostridium polyendosporum TaxID=69208 RepID=A0A919RZH0_9CLOT|nr:hypothetical protein [Clostridium polyendosporum]GIM29077.1 hypothetical protein CPJCM30710_17430 [Clostridium polyendosporum]